MIEIVVKTCLNLTKNVYSKFEVQKDRYEIREGNWLELPQGAKMVYFEGNFSKEDFLDKVEELTTEYKHEEYKIIIDGEDVTPHF